MRGSRVPRLVVLGEPLHPRAANVSPRGNVPTHRCRCPDMAQAVLKCGRASKPSGSESELRPDRAPHSARPQRRRPHCRSLLSSPGHSRRCEAAWKSRNVRSAQGRRADGGTAGVCSGSVRSAELGRVRRSGLRSFACPALGTAEVCIGKLGSADGHAFRVPSHYRRCARHPNVPQKSRPDSNRGPWLQSPSP